MLATQNIVILVICSMTVISIPLFVTLEGTDESQADESYILIADESQTDESFILIAGDTHNPTTEESAEYLVAYDLNGKRIWNDQFESTGHANSITVSNDANTIVTGIVKEYSPENKYGKHIDIRVHDIDGKELWSDMLGLETSGFHTKLNSIILHDDMVIVAGDFDGSLSGYVSAGETDGFVIAYDVNTGKKLWSDQFGGKDIDSIRSAMIQDDKIIILYNVGETFDPFGPNPFDLYVITYDLNGKILFKNKIDKSTYDIQSTTIHGDKIVFTGSEYYQKSENNIHEQHYNFVVAYDFNGKQLWNNILGYTGMSYIDLPVIYRDKVIITDNIIKGLKETCSHIVLYDLNTGKKLWNDQFAYNNTHSKIHSMMIYGDSIITIETRKPLLCGNTSMMYDGNFVVSYDLNTGKKLWLRYIDSEYTTNNTYSRMIYKDNLIEIGTTKSLLHGNTSINNYDGFITLYDIETGKKFWNTQFGLKNTLVKSISVLTHDDMVIVAGDIHGSLSGYVSAGKIDGFVIAYDINTGEKLWSDQFGGKWSDNIHNMKIISK